MEPELNPEQAAAENRIFETEQRFIQRVKKDYQMSKRSLVGRHQRFLGYLKRYYNEEAENRPKGMANSRVPGISEAVNVIVADIIEKEFKSDLNIDTMGRESQDYYFAEAIRDMIKYQVYAGNGKAKSAEAAFSMVLYGMGPAKVCYDEQYISRSKWVPVTIPGTMVKLPGQLQQVEEKYLRYKGGVIEPIDIFDWFPHPDKKSINDRTPNMHRFYPSASELEEHRSIYRNVDVVMKAIEEKNLPHDTDGTSLKKQRHNIAGLTFDESMIADCPECIEWQGWFDINGDGVERFCIGVVAIVTNEENNDDHVVLRLTESPYKDNEPTYICGRFFRVPGQFWAIGIGEMLAPDEDTETGLLRCMLDSYKRVAMPRKYAIADSLVDETELDLPWGGTVHLHENEFGTQAVREEQPGMIGQDGYNLLTLLQANRNARSGIDAMMAGRSAPGQKNTATVGSYIYNQGSARFKHMLWMFEESFVLPLCRKFHAINQQFIDKPYAIMILGEQGMYWSEVQPWQIAGDINFIALGSNREADRQVNIEQLMRCIQVYSSNPMLMAAVPILAVNLAEEFNLRNLRDIKAAVGYEQMMQQVQMAKQQGITPTQMMAMNGMAFQQDYRSPGNSTPYGGEQEQTPTNQEEMMAKTNQRMTQNFPLAR